MTQSELSSRPEGRVMGPCATCGAAQGASYKAPQPKSSPSLFLHPFHAMLSTTASENDRYI